MAKKKAEQEQPAKGAGGRPRRGPWWHSRRGRWMATFARKQHAAPTTIGQADLEGARRWYEAEARRIGIVTEPPAGADGGMAKKTFTLAQSTLEELEALRPAIAAEHMMATAGESHVVRVVIREAYVRRFPGGKEGRPKKT
jgi:hypothetical protein